MTTNIELSEEEIYDIKELRKDYDTLDRLLICIENIANKAFAIGKEKGKEEVAMKLYTYVDELYNTEIDKTQISFERGKDEACDRIMRVLSTFITLNQK